MQAYAGKFYIFSCFYPIFISSVPLNKYKMNHLQRRYEFLKGQ